MVWRLPAIHAGPGEGHHRGPRRPGAARGERFRNTAEGCRRGDLIKYQDTLRVFDNEAQYLAEAPEREAKNGLWLRDEAASGDEARELEPAIGQNVHCGAFHGGWYFVTNPGRVVKSIAAEVMRNGGEILADDVVSLEREGDRVSHLRLKAGGLHGLDKLVICAGAYSHLLAQATGREDPARGGARLSHGAADSGVSLSRSITYARTPGAATPMEMGLRLAGTDEFAGLDAAPNYKRSDALWTKFKAVLPGLREPDEQTTRWMGRRPGTPDSLPVIGPSKTTANVWYGFGHGHMGLTWGPTTGRLIAEQMTGARSNIDLTPVPGGPVLSNGRHSSESWGPASAAPTGCQSRDDAISIFLRKVMLFPDKADQHPHLFGMVHS